MSKVLIENNMQILEDQKMEEYFVSEKPRTQSAIRIRSSQKTEAERDDLRRLVDSHQELAQSTKGIVKKDKKIKSFLSLTKEMLMKNRHLGIFKNEAPLLRSLDKNAT